MVDGSPDLVLVLVLVIETSLIPFALYHQRTIRLKLENRLRAFRLRGHRRAVGRTFVSGLLDLPPEITSPTLARDRQECPSYVVDG